MNKIGTLIQKEWADVFRNRYVLYIVLLLPVLMIGIPIAVLGLGASPDMISGISGADEIPAAILAQPGYEGLDEIQAMQAFLGQQFNLFTLILPLAIPMTIATYSIVGEKRERSLEPLLAAPISTIQLLSAKAIAAAATGIAGTWLSAAIYVIAVQIIIASPVVRGLIVSSSYLISILVVTPLLTVLATTVGLIVSSRVNDPRVAEQLGMVVIVPVLALFFGQIAGLITFNVATALVVAAILLVVDVVLLQVAVRLFNRETILTRWK